MTLNQPLVGQRLAWKKAAQAFQKNLNEHYKDAENSPLEAADRASFTTLEYFPIRKAWYKKAKLVLTPNSPTFEMPTVSGITKTFRKYGELHFRLKGKKRKLNVYQNQKNLSNPKYKDYLFIPFKDLSSGNETYGGGRYIDLMIPKSNKVRLDFNQCYNPYCAYSSGWNCPIPPAENFLPVKVLAGVKRWQKGH